MPRLRIPRSSSLRNLFDRACLITALLILAATTYRRAVQGALDPYKCDALLRDGQWLDSPERDPPRRPFQNWQTPGCILHEYRPKDIASCNENGKILFVGDSATRQVFWAAVKKFDRDYVIQERARIDQHKDISYTKDGVRLKFMWDPWLNSSALYQELDEYRRRRQPESKEEVGREGGSGQETEPTRSVVMLIGGGLWHARHIHHGSLKAFKESIDNITANAYVSSKNMVKLRSVTLSSEEGIGDQIFFAPVLEPRYELLTPAREKTILPEKVEQMNSYLAELSSRYSLNVLWSYANMTRGKQNTYGESGIHVIDPVAGRMADVLLNLRCNAKNALRNGYPFNRTCCSNYRPMNWVQILITLGVLVALLVVALRWNRHTPASTPVPVAVKSPIRPVHPRFPPGSNASPSVIGALTIILLCVCVAFVADRTHLFVKVRRQYDVLGFRILFLIPFLACAPFIRTVPTLSGRATRPNSSPETQTTSTFLPRVQAEEWKGWMQIYVLIYAYTAASSELDFYKVLRILVASYLFITGYGHTTYFLQTNDYSFRRVVAVLARLNILALALSFMMARPYASYYFAPLASFWFLVIYFILKSSHARNESVPFVLGKIACFGLMVSIVIYVRGFLEFVNFVLGKTCNATLDVEEWRFFLSVDKYIVFAGMLVALIHLRVRAIFASPQNYTSPFSKLLTQHFSVIQLAFLAVSAVTIPVFWTLTGRSPDRGDYNWWMPFLSWLPVVSFALLRNSTQFLRNHHSAAFAWLGRMSLETYLLSQHLWLAGDGWGLLRTGLFQGDGSMSRDRWRDFVILTPLFLWACWKVRAATAIIVALIAGENNVQVVETSKKHSERLGNGPRLPDVQLGAGGGADGKPIDGDRKGSGWPGDLKRRMMVLGFVLWVCSWIA